MLKNWSPFLEVEEAQKFQRAWRKSDRNWKRDQWNGNFEIYLFCEKPALDTFFCIQEKGIFNVSKQKTWNEIQQK